MKQRRLLVLALSSALFLAGCGNAAPSEPVVDSFTVTFNSHGGSTVASMQKVKVVETEPETTRNGYNFTGWYENTEYSERVTFPYTVTRDITLHAGWEEAKYLVTFDTDEGTPVDSMTVSVIQTAPVTAKDGYDFLGWFTSTTSETAITFPYTVDHAQTLYARWKKQYNFDDVEIMSVSTSLGTATAYMKGSYEANYLQVIVRVVDRNVFNEYSNSDGSVNGMNDNVEIYVSPRNDQVYGLIDGETINVIAVPGKNYQAKRFFNSPDYKYTFNYSYPFKSGLTVTSKICNSSDDGFDGYTVTFQLPYSLFNSTRDAMINKTSVFLAMRNTDKGTSSTPTDYGESKFMANEIRNAWTHPILKENGDFEVRKVDKMLIGDSYTDSEFFKKLKASYTGKGLYGRGISGAKASEWLNQYFPNIVASRPDDIIIHIGVNDINGNSDKTGVPTFATLRQLMEKIHESLPTTNIHWITITDNHFEAVYQAGVNPFEPGYHYCNEQMKALAAEADYLYIIDYAAATEGQISLFLDDGLHPNMMGYDIMTDLIDQEFNITRSSGTVFGKAGKYVTSTGYDLSNDSNQIISTNGDYNQYAWVKNESPKSTFSFEVGMNAVSVSHGDSWPKMGLVIKSGEKMLFYFVDMLAGMTGKSVGYVMHYNISGHWGTDFDWSTSQASSSLGINYTGNNYVNLKATYSDGNVKLFADGNEIFTVTNPFNGGDAYFGLLSFNTAFRTNKVVVSY